MQAVRASVLLDADAVLADIYLQQGVLLVLVIGETGDADTGDQHDNHGVES